MNTIFGSLAATFARIAGFQASRRANKALFSMRPQRDARVAWADNSRYTGDKLREIRKRKGIGRRKGFDVWSVGIPNACKVYPALLACVWEHESPNLAEWKRKQRRGESNEDYLKRKAS